MDMPKCCGKNMSIEMETSTYYEMVCPNCGDRVYIKKEQSAMPQLIDD